jgi:tetratricopeptide (TPR) repeat protein
MRHIIFFLFASLALAVPSASFAKPTDQGWELIRDKKPAEAIVVLDRVIADEASRHADERRQIYCAHSPEESLMYTGMAAKEHKDAVVLDPTWCMAIFLKGFALIDLDRPDEAKPLFDQAVAMAPMNSQFLAELGEWHKVRHEWDTAYDLFERAGTAADLSATDIRISHKGRALRGMGFVLIEKGQLDEAERLFRQALELNPNDEGAKGELQYIKQQRDRRS